jgi:DNA helicase II / ATP-dependent DNA helicase PcrA
MPTPYKNEFQLSDAQRDAVVYAGSALVVAGAGSGKTRTLTAKIAHLIHSGHSSRRILGITFTNKAAGEMKQRLMEMTGFPMEEFPWVRTFHSASFKILRQHCRLLGYSPPIQIFAEYQQQKLLKEILIRLNIDKKFLSSIISQISGAKNSGDPEDYLIRSGRKSYLRLEDVYHLYEKELFAKNAVDFDNILLMTRNLLRDHPEVREQYQRCFSYVLVDEYQDTNDIQEDLTGLLLGDGHIFCVGDDWQAIYGFRGSNVNHFLRFTEKYPSARIFRLEENYRSAGEIVLAANDLIRHNARRMEKECYSSRTGGRIKIEHFFSDDEEAEWVAGQIRALQRKKIPCGKMAVLYRTKFCSYPFEKMFRSNGIPYRMLGSKGFFERKEILDITCYLTAAVFEKDDASVERIMNIPKRGIGPGTIAKIRGMGQEDDGLQAAIRRSVAASLLSGKNYRALRGLVDLIDRIRDMRPDAAIRQVLDETGYLEYLRGYSKTADDYTTRVENIEQLIYSASQHASLLDYLEEAALIREDREESEDADSGVSLSTIHASKGLEYQVVFVVGCEENLLPHWKAKENPGEVDEERRLMYVAMTRAENYLYLTSAGYRKGQYNPRSRFVDEIASSV